MSWKEVDDSFFETKPTTKEVDNSFFEDEPVKKKSGGKDAGRSSNVSDPNGLSISNDGLEVPQLNNSQLYNILNPVNAIKAKQVTTPNGATFNIDESKLPAPMRTTDAVKSIQEQINTGLNTPELQSTIANSSGKSVHAVNAYLQGDNKTGSAIDRLDFINNNKLALSSTIKNLNQEAGTSYDPDETLADPDKLSNFIQDYKSKMGNKVVQNTSSGIFDPMRHVVDPSIRQRSSDLLSEFQGLQQPILTKHLIKTTVEQDLLNGVAPEVTNEKIAKRTNPINYKNSKEALATATGLDTISDTSTPFQIIGAAIDDLVGTNPQKEVLNSVIGQADLQRNDAIMQLALDKQAEAHVNNNESAMTSAKQLIQSYNPDLIYNYPAILKQQMAFEISQDVAKDSGQMPDVQGEDGAHNVGVKFFGETQEGYARRMREKGWFDNPKTRDIATDLLNHPELFSDASYLGSTGNSFLKPFKDLGLSVSDVLGVRSKADVVSDKIKDEMFPLETPGISQTAKNVRTFVNTTSNLAGMATIASITGGIGRAAGIGLSEAEVAEFSSPALTTERGLELAGKSIDANNRIATLSNAASFGLPSIDANLKDSYNFIDNDAARAAYVTMGGILNTYGGKLLNLPTISKVPELSETFIKAAQGLSEKTLTQDAARELLNEGKKPYIDYLLKYGKNVTEGAATMAYFTATNEILKSAFGDPNTTGEDIVKNTGTAFLDGVLGMLVFGAVKTAGEFNENKNSSFKNNIYQMAIMPDAAKDVFLLSKSSEADYNQKVQILNTAVAAKNALEATQLDTNIPLSEQQKAAYVANKTTEAYVRAVAEKTSDESRKKELLSRADRLRDQSVATLDGLKFTKTLEPLYDLYQAEKEYDKAYADFEANGNEVNQRVLEEKKSVYDDLQNKYFDKQYGDVVDVIPKEYPKIEDKNILPTLSKVTPVLSADQINKTQPVFEKINNAENVNEKEISEAENVLYETLDKHGYAAHLIEPLIQKLQDYEFTTKTETRTVTEERPIEGSFRNKSKPIEIKPALEKLAGSEATVTLPDGGVRNGTLNIKGGKYVLDIPGSNQIEIGEKAITDRDLKLPDESKVENPIGFDKDGNVESVTFETKNGNLVTVKNPEQALDIAIQLQADAIGKVPDAVFEPVFEKVSKEVNVEVPNYKESKDNLSGENKSNAAEKLVEPYLNKGALIGIEKPEDALKFIAQQAQNVSEDGKDLSGNADARASVERAFTPELVDAAIKKFPRESLLKEPSAETKPVTVEGVTEKSDINFRSPEEAQKLLSEKVGDTNSPVEFTDIYGDKTGVGRPKDIQRRLVKEHKLLDLLVNCLTK